MKIIFFFNKSISFKTISLYMFAKIINDNNKKVLVVNFDIKKNSYLNSIGVDYINFDNWLNNSYQEFLKTVEERKDVYDFILVDSSSSLSEINLNILKMSNNVIIPIDVSNDNSKEILEILLSLKTKEKFDTKFNFFACGFNKNDIISINSLLKIKKNLNSLLSNVVINKYEFSNIEDLYNNKILMEEYKNLITSLKII